MQARRIALNVGGLLKKGLAVFAAAQMAVAVALMGVAPAFALTDYSTLPLMTASACLGNSEVNPNGTIDIELFQLEATDNIYLKSPDGIATYLAGIRIDVLCKHPTTGQAVGRVIGATVRMKLADYDYADAAGPCSPTSGPCDPNIAYKIYAADPGTVLVERIQYVSGGSSPSEYDDVYAVEPGSAGIPNGGTSSYPVLKIGPFDGTVKLNIGTDEDWVHLASQPIGIHSEIWVAVHDPSFGGTVSMSGLIAEAHDIFAKIGDPVLSVTPELGSVGLFGSGLASMAAYAYAAARRRLHR